MVLFRMLHLWQDLGELNMQALCTMCYRGVDDRNLLVLTACQTGILNNKKSGDVFGITYSSVSHIVRTVRKRILRDKELEQKITTINSLFKM